MTRNRKRLNVKLALALLGCGLVLAVAIHFLHGAQVRRGARGLLEEAGRLEQAGQQADAVDYLERYLLLAPDDPDARARHALLIGKLARGPKDRLRAYFVLGEASRRNPDRQDVRRALVGLALELGEFKDARENIVELQKDGAKDAELLWQRARVEAADQQTNEAVRWYRRAIEAAPADPELSLEYAAVLRDRLKDPQAADDEVGRLVRVGGDSAQVRVAAAGYYQRSGAVEKAEQTVLTAAGAVRSDDPEELLLAAELALLRDQGEAARRHLDRGAGLFPKDPRFSHELARLELRGGQREKALALLQPHLKAPPEEPEGQWRLGNLLVDLGELDRAEELAARLGKTAPGWAADYLRGRLLMRKGDWADARELLERDLGTGRGPPAEVAGQVYLLIAECHGRLANPDGQETACRKALAIDPELLPARQTLAAALVSLGKTEEAVREYRSLGARSPEARAALARLLIGRTLRQPEADRRWGEVEGLLKDLPDGHRVEAQLLRAEVLAGQGKTDEARRLAEAERDRDPKQVGPWLFLIGLAERGPDPKAVLSLADEAERQAGSRAEWLLARAQALVKAGGPEVAVRLAGLEAATDRLSDAEKERFLLGLGASFLAAGDAVGAERVWRRLADGRPTDPAARFRLFGLVAEKDEGQARGLIEEMKRIEGPDGPLASFAEATLHARRARQGDRGAIEPARQALARSLAARPSWGLAIILDGELDELKGQKAKALEKYLAVVDGGQAPVEVFRKVAQFMTEQGRYAEARAVLGRLPEQVVENSGLARASAQLSLLSVVGPDGRGGESARKQALEAARKAVGAGSTEYRDYLWLGEMALLAGDQAEAERAFRQARNLKPTAPEPWIAIVGLLSRADAKKAEAELEAARAKLGPGQLPRVLAVGYEALGRVKEAGEQFRAIVAGRSDDPVALQDMAAFQLRTGDRAEGERTLRRLLALGAKVPSETMAWARRALALTLAAQGGFDRFKEANALMEENFRDRQPTAEDRWNKALVLASQPGRRREAIGLLEEVVVPASAPPNARLMLAQLYEKDGQWDQAHSVIRSLLRAYDRNPTYLAYYASALIRQGQPAAAEPWVERLVGVTGETAATVGLHARVFKGRKRPEEAAKAVKAFVEGKGEEASLAAAHLLDELDLTTDAEQMYRAYAAVSKDPQAPLRLASYLARRGRLPEALTLCEQAWKTCPPEAVARTCVAALRAGRGGEEQSRRVEGWLNTAINKKPGSTILLVILGDLKQHREQFTEAAELYRQIIRQDPRNVVALNNLAFLLAVKDGKAEEAVALIDAALNVTGPHSELLDTRAIVLTRAGRPDDAAADLRRAIADSPSAVKQFHLAQAHLKAGRQKAAAEAYQEATEAALEPADLHPLERADWVNLSRDIKRR